MSPPSSLPRQLLKAPQSFSSEQEGSEDEGEEEDISDYEPYFEPASYEEELIAQLTAKLAVPVIPRENLK